MIRLIIYLIVSLAILFLLYAMYLNSNHPSFNKVKDKPTAIPIDLSEDKDFENYPQMNLSIDSLSNYHLNQKIIQIDELKDSLAVFSKKEPKPIIKFDVHPNSKSGYMKDVLEIAHKMNLKILIR